MFHVETGNIYSIVTNDLRHVHIAKNMNTTDEYWDARGQKLSCPIPIITLLAALRTTKTNKEGNMLYVSTTSGKA